MNSERIRLLIVEDDDDFRDTVMRWFTRKGWPVEAASGGQAALDLCARQTFSVGVLDLRMPGMSGLELLERLNGVAPEMEVLILTGEGTIETAVEAMKMGASDYLTKPFPLAELEQRVIKAHEAGELRRENRQLKAVIERSRPKNEMIGRSAAMKEVFRLIERAGPTDKAILIQGESGTGKELVAQALQRASRRADRPFVVINCAALPESLLESELFGHEKGAFTGAFAAKQGLFEVADGGTLFIDEIGELASSLQAKLLRVLEDGSFRRVGSLKERRADVRLLAATNRKLLDEVRDGRFREDLYYRINVMSLELPPLRERTGDIPLLVERFLGPDWQIEADALQAIEQSDWPGNIRQLLNAIERAKILADDQVVRRFDLPRDVLDAPRTAPQTATADDDDLASVERSHVIEVLNREGGNKSRAARALGINRRTLYRLLERYGLH
jgi:DNA-binding NtrC family response regulator